MDRRKENNIQVAEVIELMECTPAGWSGQKKRKIIYKWLRSLKLMECTPAGWSTPAAYGLRNYVKQINNTLSPLPTTREVVYALSSPGESEQTLTQCRVQTKGIGLFTTTYLIHNNPQLCYTPTPTPSPPVTLSAYCSSPPPEFWCP